MTRPPMELLEDGGFAPLTRSVLAEQLGHIGVRTGDTVMVHVRLSAFQWVVGGMDTVIAALLDSVGAAGTVMAFCGWEASPYQSPLLPERWQTAYRETPPFDPARSPARRDFGSFPERLRCRPGAVRSAHPEVSFAAVGAGASALLTGSDQVDPWGVDGPLGRLVARHGRVLMLGAPIKKLTLCHHAEAIARVDGKRYHEYQAPIATPCGTEWRTYRTLDTYYGALPYYERADLQITSPAENLANQAVAAGAGRSAQIGAGTVWLFESEQVVRAAVNWLESHF